MVPITMILRKPIRLFHSIVMPVILAAPRTVSPSRQTIPFAAAPGLDSSGLFHVPAIA
jgi:hypothetical protein